MKIAAGTADGPQSPARMHETVSVIALIVCSLLVFGFLEGGIGVLGGMTPNRVVAAALVISLGLGWKRSALPLPFIALVFAVNAVCIVYIAASWQTYDLGLGAGWANSVWIPVIAGLAAVARPALVLVPALAVQWSKVALGETIGGAISGRSDYIIIPDLALLIGIFLAIYTVFQIVRATGKRFSGTRFALPALAPASFFTACVIAMAGIHLSNYFYSGWEKLFLANGTPLTWVLENPTYMLAVHTHDLGMLTLPNVTGWTDSLYHWLMVFNTPLNIAVVVAQLAALPVLLSLRASGLLTFFYDVMHLAILALTSIFFWKWIVLNAAFIVAFGALRRHGRPVPRHVLVFGCLLVLAAPYLSFNIARLAWFDTGGVNEVRFEALTADGATVRVPSNFFLNDSIGVAQQRFTGALASYLPTQTWGTTADADILAEMQNNCVAAAKPWSLAAGARDKVQTVVDRHYAQALALSSDGSGRFPYDVYPHHIWSAPWLYNEFANLDLRTVRAYVLVVEGRCVTVGEDGHVTRASVGSSRYDFPVKAR